MRRRRASVRSLRRRSTIPHKFREWVKQAEKNSRMRDGITTEEPERIKALEREGRGRRQPNAILRKAGVSFARVPLADVSQTIARCLAGMFTRRELGSGNAPAHSSNDRLRARPPHRAFSMPCQATGSPYLHANRGGSVWCLRCQVVLLIALAIPSRRLQRNRLRRTILGIVWRAKAALPKPRRGGISWIRRRALRASGNGIRPTNSSLSETRCIR
jgi:hypothetical protein